MILKLKTSIVFFFLCTLSIFAQKSELSGKVVDADQNFPLEYATISVIDAETKETVNGGVTNIQGEFKFKVPKGLYDLKVEYISFETKMFENIDLTSNKNMGTIKLGFEAADLEEVVVTAETTTVDVRLDKKIYNIGKDLTTSGATITDALANVPSVDVDVEGGISLRGNENVRILINGKPSAIAGFGSTDVLRQLPADAIDKVEVITSPSARYDAEGTAGILNIILKRDKTLGFNGSVRAYVGTPLNQGVSVNANARTDKFNIFTNLGYSKRKPDGNAYFENDYTSNNSVYDNLMEEREYKRNRENYNANIGSTYFINDTTQITLSYFTRFGDDVDKTFNDTYRYNAGSLSSQTLRTEDEREDENSHQVSLNFEKKYDREGHKLTADIQYSIDNEKTSNFIDENELFANQDNIVTESLTEKTDEKDFLVQADYVLPMGEAQFEAGFRGNYKNEKNDYILYDENNLGDFVLNDSVSNVFEYDRNITAVYSQYGNKFGDFSFLLGLRFEHTQLKGKTTPYGDVADIPGDIELDFDKNFKGLFPTVNLTYELSEDQNVTLGYNRRINRPRSWYINPFPSRSSRTNIFQGNPGLEPAYSDAFDIGYLKRWGKELTLTSSVYYQKETDSFERVQEDTGQTTSDGIPIIRSIPINLSSNERYGAELGLLYNPARWLRLNGSINYYKFVTEGDFNGVNYDADNESFFARFSSKVDLPWSIQWQTNAFYRGARENAQTKTEPIASLNLALSKDILNDNATISLNVSDLFNSRKRENRTITDQFTSYSEFQWRERQITATFVYRFNQNKQMSRQQGRGQGNGDGGEGEF
ncbi:TonB-dependent receptor domain-containing protein [Psychroflexus halocasei]|uniref:Outer membrane receptor proteins, mostly Fe transport n=1 Tax=Psychroflexus halocasei TaxID=908615 RepID=A0A1H3ZTP7_9FLAO|nr:TonB-dependent receptor [Psychroflexus halocasei]SEA26664.1 Outer membrane receptor proteins, mostly Fe transport [Psychroflexus halocasei]